ncbi:MAG TPA: IS5/IS1182 family transposase, partial [Acinetobacter sp.]|nr:IS5/IS1182 family transposase [Acinetobacter sp.]HAB43352.1 IS5/IS1182 family transposase [Acinetobacter sp.]
MPRTMLTDQHSQKLKSILRNLSIHHNSNLLTFIEAI